MGAFLRTFGESSCGRSWSRVPPGFRVAALQFASQSDAPVGAPRRFGSTEHLSPEAIAAYVDGELRMTAHLRAAHHLSLCQQCAAEIDAQSQAREALRDSRRSRFRAACWVCCRRFRVQLMTSRWRRPDQGLPTSSPTAQRGIAASAGRVDESGQQMLGPVVCVHPERLDMRSI